MAREEIDDDSVVDVFRKMSIFLEEARDGMNILSKSIDLAEAEGWRNKDYYMIQDQFEVAKRNIKAGLDELEDASIPIIRELMKDRDL